MKHSLNMNGHLLTDRDLKLNYLLLFIPLKAD